MSSDLRPAQTVPILPIRGSQPLSEDARRIGALYRMTDRLYHAQSDADVFDAALQAIISGLECDRASILLFDEARVMRFVAWEGLPDHYRKAAEGHSPWDPDERHAQPVCVEDIEKADFDPALKQVILKEGIRAAAFIPLCVDGALIGKFMAYFNVPHAFENDEMELSQTIARQLAFAVQRRRSEQGHRHTEDALTHQRRLYEAILTNTPDLAYVWDRHHRFMYANEGLLKMWGKTWDEAIGRNCLELGYEPWHAEMHDREIEQVIATRQPVRGEVPFTGTFGRRIYDYILVPVISAEGEAVAVAGITRDVTERHEADRRKDEFLAMLAHELRNPLAPISNAVHILRREKSLTPNQLNAHAIIARQTAQLARMVDDLLEVSRITTGRIQLRREWIVLSGVVEGAVQSVRSLIEQQCHELTVLVPEEPIWVHADATRLEQVLVNLLNNAAKYTTQRGRIDLTVRWSNGNALISVRDTGIGIEPQLLPRVFDLFTQAERSLDRSYGGLGVGLSLVKSLVEMHGGEVQASSELGKGSEFVVRLPASPNQVAASAAPKAAPAAVEKLRILVVDDNVDAAESVAMLLQCNGHDVRLAHDGVAALQVAKEYLPDAVLLDVGLPHMSGYEVAKHLREDPELAQAMLIAMTGYGQAQDRQRSQEAGFDMHLVKPVDFSDVEAALANLVAARAAAITAVAP